MTTTELLELSAAILASIGGGGAIILGMSSWLGKVWAERILNKEKSKYAEDLEAFRNKLTFATESHKIKLKKSEFIFAKEFEAASTLVSLVRDISPQISRPDMDWYAACDEMATNFHTTENLLHAYLRQHGAILPNDVRSAVTVSYGLASQNKFDDGSADVTKSANAAAGAMLESLQDAEAKMIARVHSQVTV